MQRALALVLIATALALAAGADAELRCGSVFRSVNDAQRIKIASDDELEFTPDRDGPNYVCKYSRDGDSLRVVVTVLGSSQAIYFKFVLEGLQRPDGTILYDDAHFEAASKAAVAERERQLAAAVASPVSTARPSTAPVLSLSEAKAFALDAPRPDYPYEARSRKITGSGVAVLTVDARTGAVMNASMAQSIGSPILDNAVVSAFRRWRFKPGTVSKVKVPITYTMTGVLY